ncbi:MAG: bifunctional heptose 7-phosphate kinase/heptose 1-phosphate adenyltransferase [Vicinamibacterales bacterium]
MSDDAPQLPPLDHGRALALFDAVGAVHVVVVGDVMLDHFMVGRVSRVSPEAPVPVLEFDREFSVPGGAANVAHNAAALGARVTLVGLVGDDAAAADLRGLIEGRGISARGLVVDPTRPTTRKTRLATTRNQQVARVDVERAVDADDRLGDALARVVEEAAADAAAIIVSDYLKGVVTPAVMARVVAAAHGRGVPLLVDPKVPHVDRYAGATLLTPNHHEAEAATGLTIREMADVRRAARQLTGQARVGGVLVTWGEQGMWLSHGVVEGHLPAAAREVADVTGAGDTVVAVCGALMAAGATSAEAARLANQAAGVVVTRFGASAVTADELRQRLGTSG